MRLWGGGAVYSAIREQWLPCSPGTDGVRRAADRPNQPVPAFQALAEYWLGMIGVDLAERGELSYEEMWKQFSVF